MPEYGGLKVVVDGKDLYLYRDTDILGIVHNWISINIKIFSFILKFYLSKYNFNYLFKLIKYSS